MHSITTFPSIGKTNLLLSCLPGEFIEPLYYSSLEKLTHRSLPGIVLKCEFPKSGEDPMNRSLHKISVSLICEASSDGEDRLVAAFEMLLIDSGEAGRTELSGAPI